MASIAIPLFSFTVLLLLLPLLFQAVLADLKNKKPSPFQFLQHLQGCHKGDKVKDIHKLKKYLENFGYLSYKNMADANDDEFHESLESAIKTYQLNYHLKATGTLEAKTVSKMMTPRCAVADIINGEPKWPASKSHLTYDFLPGTRADAFSPVVKAFQTWAANTHFSFSRTEDPVNADIIVGFGGRDHGDGLLFDGPGGTLAHAYPPTNWRFHYDADEQCSTEGAIMYPTFMPGQSKGLHGDDIQGIRALYNN
ncbi:hypothetical protein DITRI_Ditri09bG0033600 [Diplodiscus trichospermus]